ncbi:hypothetical protein ACVXHB_09610 [Escherichia coli]
MLRCKSPRAEQTCRRLSCVYPDICPHMDTNHEPTINLYRRARDLKGIKILLPLVCVMTSPWKIGAISKTGDPSRRRLSEDCPGTYRRRAVIEDDEAGHGQL